MISKKDATYYINMYEKEKKKLDKELLLAQILYSELSMKKENKTITEEEEEKRQALPPDIAKLKDEISNKNKEIKSIQMQFYEPLFDEIMERKSNPTDIKTMMNIVDEIRKKDDKMKGYKKAALFKKIKSAVLRELEKEIYNK